MLVELMFRFWAFPEEAPKRCALWRINYSTYDGSDDLYMVTGPTSKSRSHHQPDVAMYRAGAMRPEYHKLQQGGLMKDDAPQLIQGRFTTSGVGKVDAAAFGSLGVDLIHNGAALYAVVDNNGDFRVYAGYQNNPCANIIAQGNLSHYKEV